MKPIYKVVIGIAGGLCISLASFVAVVLAWGGDVVLVYGPLFPFVAAALAWLGAIVAPIVLR